jgi:hypothetical protein
MKGAQKSGCGKVVLIYSPSPIIVEDPAPGMGTPEDEDT